VQIIFKSQHLLNLYSETKDNNFKIQKTIVKKFRRVVKELYAIKKIDDLRNHVGLNYKKLKGDMRGISSVRLNRKFRILFNELSLDSDQSQIEILEILEISNHYE